MGFKKIVRTDDVLRNSLKSVYLVIKLQKTKALQYSNIKYFFAFHLFVLELYVRHLLVHCYIAVDYSIYYGPIGV